MEEQIKKSENVLQTSYTRNFYIDGVENIQKIADENKDNPAQTEMLGTAYIDGLVKEMPAKEAEKISQPLRSLLNAQAESQLQEFNEKQVTNAELVAESSVGKAYNIAKKSYEDNEPVKVQEMKTSLYLKTLQDEVDSGRTPLEVAQKMRLSLAHGKIMNELTATLVDDSLSNEKKYQALKDYVFGNTKSEAIDKYTSPEDRAQFGMQALNTAEQILNFRNAYEARQEKAAIAGFDDAYVELAPVIFEYNGYDRPGRTRFDRENAINTLLNKARTPEQMKQVVALKNAKFVDDPIAKEELDYAFAMGVADKETVDKNLQEANIGLPSYGEYVQKMQTPLYQNQQSYAYKNAKEMIEMAFPIDRNMAGNVSVMNGVLSVSSNDPNAKLQFDRINELNAFCSSQIRQPKEIMDFVNSLIKDSDNVKKYAGESRKKELDVRIKMLNNNMGGKEISENIKKNMVFQDSTGRKIERTEQEARKMVTFDIVKRLEAKGASESVALQVANEIMNLQGEVEW